MQTQTQVPLDCLASGGAEVSSCNKGNMASDEDPQTGLKRYRKNYIHVLATLARTMPGRTMGTELRLHVFCLYLVCVCVVPAGAYRARKDNGTYNTSTRA